VSGAAGALLRRRAVRVWRLRGYVPKLQGFDHEKSLASGCNGCFDWDIAGMTMINGNVMGYSEVVMFFSVWWVQ